MADITKAAPRIRLRFLPKRDADPDLLRGGLVHLEIGKRGTSAPEIRTFYSATNMLALPEADIHSWQAER
jgi:hypothetical protein